MAQTVIGIFDNATEAQEAVQKLVNNGFSRENIDIALKNTSSASSGSSLTGTDAGGDYATGSLTGSNYSDTTSSSSTLNTHLENNENLGTAVGGAYTDGNDNQHKGSAIGNFFRSLFGSDDEADTFSNVAGKTGSIVTVHAKTSEEAEEAADILDDAGAVDVNERASQFGYSRGSDISAQNTGATTLSSDNASTTGTSIPIIEEQLQVGKKTVETGGKRLRSRIVERPVEESLRLREERVWVERNSVNRPATEADLANFQEKEFELVERAEVPVVAKEARVVEEVSLGKEVDERTETIQDTVRSTEVDVEDIENTTTRKSSGSTGYSSTDDLASKF